MTDRLDDIAIISLAGRFPGAKNVEQFWQNLAAGVEAIRPFTSAEVLATGIDPACLQDPDYVTAGAPLDDIDCFDAAFFGYSPKEATLMDPQQRVFLEYAWEALERAGYAPTQCPGRVGVYAGVSSNDYWQILQTRPDLTTSVGDYQTLLGNDKDFLSTRISYKLNLKGPSLTVQTACSTALVATNLACQSLLAYQCDMALAGGVSIHVPQTAGYRYQPGSILSPDGHCRAFDAQAQGTVGGNGVGLVVLKRLEDAIAAGDPIYAVIRGAAMNNDGADKVGYTAPSVTGQANAIEEALAIAAVPSETLSYVETHGTGTTLGDPIEIAALTQAFNTSKRQFCAVGSVKSNIGHLDAAAGIAGLIKTTLALHHRQLPPSLHFEQPNPQIDFANSPFYVNTQLQDWQSQLPRRAGVSAMGIGGTNAHIVLEEAPALKRSGSSRPSQLLLLSAKTPEALTRAAQNLAQHLETHTTTPLSLPDVAYTLQVGREDFAYRHKLVCQHPDEAIADLKAYPSVPAEPVGQQPSVAFLFPGQGTQYVEMARELYETEPDFRQTIDACSEHLQSQAQSQDQTHWDLRSLLYPQPDQLETAQAQLQQTAIAQPALFVIEYALARFWMQWGVEPQALLGHSLGEYVAACLAGVFSLADALYLVTTRGKLMQEMPAGQMLSVALSEEQLQPYLGDASGDVSNNDLWLAVNNGPQLCVVSGTVVAIAALQTRLEADSIVCRLLKTSHAFHSPLMTAALEPFQKAVSQVTLHPPQIPLISNVTGTWLTPEAATDPKYWADHLRQPVQFSKGVGELLKQLPTVLLEVGPGRTLATLARQQVLGDTQVLTSLRHPKDSVSDLAFLLDTLGQLWQTGTAINWTAFYAHEQRRRVRLPTYPFERQPYWIELAPAAAQSVTMRDSRSPIAQPVDQWFYLPSWKQSPIPYAADANTGSAPQTWLIFIDEQGLGERLAQRLMAEHHRVISVHAGAQFQQQENGYGLNPSQPSDYQALVRSLNAAGQHPDVIVHGWSLSLRSLATVYSNEFETAQDLGFYSVLFLTQSLQHAQHATPLTLWLLTNQVHDITGAELLHPEQASVVGMPSVISQECPSIRCCSLDVALPDVSTPLKRSPEALDSVIDSLWADLMNRDPGDLMIAYRGSHRWRQTFDALPLPALEQRPQRLRSHGVYLITGGLTGIGLAIAQYLAQAVQAKLAFLEPEALPPRDQWPQWLSIQPDTHPLSRKISSLQQLESLGSDVLIVTAQVDRHDQVQSAIEQIESTWGSIQGVLHTAETTAEASFRPIQQTERTDCEWQFSPKARGLQVLATVLKDRSLDFCLVQSSISAQLGGFIAHSAANWSMDAFVHALHKNQQTPWISVNWEGWRFWEKGDSVTTATLSPEEGVETFKRILMLCHPRWQIPQVVVSTTDLTDRIQQQTHRLDHTANLVKSNHSLGEHHPSPIAPENGPQNAIEQTVAEIWRDLLGIEHFDRQDAFFELGGHSLLAVQVMSRIREAFQVELPLRILLIEQPTIAGLAAAIAAEIAATTPAISASQSSQPKRLDEVQLILDDLEGLSSEDLKALLATS
ncbi:MAG: hypothetical protein DCF25_13595 [Leptolyngbya foveolarum]|uniref:Uncharacterized protein n=1 Tax=Leptolyngbya foveolarum TaxID=47253 RepID=A0A2W4U3V4_9CYAN|nr:MAG: hypothetical protein DCF25_13595 [Leptolyngbya foveolarum]